ncbi:MAG: hypothetical protein ACOCUV_03070 [bacterium]
MAIKLAMTHIKLAERKRINLIAVLISSISLITGCISGNKNVNIEYIKSNTWQHEKGFKVGEGDFMEFEDTTLYNLKGDTIFYKGERKAVIKSFNSKYNILKIKGISVGYYINVVEFTK